MARDQATATTSISTLPGSCTRARRKPRPGTRPRLSKSAPATTSTIPELRRSPGISPSSGTASSVVRAGISDSNGMVTKRGERFIATMSAVLAITLSPTEARAGSQYAGSTSVGCHQNQAAKRGI